jgi:hypothetical protein
MSGLRAFQEEMRRQIFPGAAPGGSAALWGGPPPERLKVYRNNVGSNWRGTLDVDFRLTMAQFEPDEWRTLQDRFFARHPAGHWELNASMAPFLKFLEREGVRLCVRELADFEWHDLAVFIDRASVRKGGGVSNPTAVARVYKHQIFRWAEASAPKDRPPREKPEVLLFYRDSRDACHVLEADPLMLLMVDHFRSPRARLDDLEPVRRRLLPGNTAPLPAVLEDLKKKDIIL